MLSLDCIDSFEGRLVSFRWPGSPEVRGVRDAFVEIDLADVASESASEDLLPRLDLGNSLDKSNLAGFFLDPLSLEKSACWRLSSAFLLFLERSLSNGSTKSTCNSGLLWLTGGNPFLNARSRAEDSDVC